MPDTVTFNKLGQLATGGIAILYRIVLGDGRQAILRELQSSKILNLSQQHCFRQGTRLRELLSPHPNLANSIERGTHGFKPYEIIEYVDGKNLKIHINNREPAIQKNLIFVLRECAEALAWVHQNGYMHLDVKPENFLIHLTSSQPVVKLTDFDLAQPADWNAPHPQMGTPAYMAPEQLRNKTAFLASDVFAFSIMAYQLVTGKSPFPADTQKESIQRQASESFVPKPPTEFVPDLPAGISRCIMTGLEKKRDRRYPNMMAFLADLRNA